MGEVGEVQKGDLSAAKMQLAAISGSIALRRRVSPGLLKYLPILV